MQKDSTHQLKDVRNEIRKKHLFKMAPKQINISPRGKPSWGGERFL